jgi:hypothetical protein
VKPIASLVVALLVAAALAVSAQADPSEYGVEAVSASASTNQAGAHPDFTVAFKLRTDAKGLLPATTREIAIDLPPGLLADPSAIPQCSAAQLVATDVGDETNKAGCPQDSQVGITEVLLRNSNSGVFFSLTEPIYNMEPPGEDAVARFGFIAQTYPIFIDAHLRSDGDFGATARIVGASSLIPLLSASTTLWGVPADESHDTQRITPYEAAHCSGAPCTAPGGLRRSSGVAPAPFMVNPTRCGVPREVKVTASSYALPDQPVSRSVSMPPISGCGAIGFKPSLTVTPTSREAASPTGLDATASIPQNESVNGFATSQLRYATVILPEGMTIAAGAGAGLGACSAQQVGLGGQGPAHCPDASKIGTAEIDSPPLSRTIDGAVYQRTPVKGDLFGVWLVSDELGIHLKLPGEVHLNPSSGQITAIFSGTTQGEGLPQAPVSAFRLHFKSGPRAPLANPSACGTYFTHYEFTPWSGAAAVAATTPMVVDEGCASGGFSPKLSGGSSRPVAGAFAAFITELTRESGEQEISTFSLVLPPGVLAKLAGVGLCEGGAVTTGDCPPASRIGAVSLAAGPGTSPVWLPQPYKEPTSIYLSGPYRDAPYGLVVKTPVQVGPFDLGTVVTRAAIYVNPVTAQATVVSDPLPQFLEGVPSSLRVVHVDVNRPKFTVNPTDCDPSRISARVKSAQGATAAPSASFRVGGCRELTFAPKLSISLHGRTNRGAHPRLRSLLETQSGDANIGSAQVALPHAEFLDQAHIRTVCTRVQFAADNCPSGSIYGHAKAITPLLSRPLEGPVYLRSSTHPLPDLVVALRGQVDLDLVGRIDSVNGGVRATFSRVPDAPVSKFTLSMRGGHRGLLVNSRGLCKTPSRAIVKFGGQNGKVSNQSPRLKNDCAKSSGKQKK